MTACYIVGIVMRKRDREGEGGEKRSFFFIVAGCEKFVRAFAIFVAGDTSVCFLCFVFPCTKDIVPVRDRGYTIGILSRRIVVGAPLDLIVRVWEKV